MPAIMADHDVQGQFSNLLHILHSPPWRGIWDNLGITIETFESMQLAMDASDVLVWQACQRRQVILFPGNRNHESPDSLEAAIRMFNQVTSLPVITLSDPRRFNRDRAYAERVAERLLEYLLDLDKHLGVGRLYVP